MFCIKSGWKHSLTSSHWQLGPGWRCWRRWRRWRLCRTHSWTTSRLPLIVSGDIYKYKYQSYGRHPIFKDFVKNGQMCHINIMCVFTLLTPISIAFGGVFPHYRGAKRQSRKVENLVADSHRWDGKTFNLGWAQSFSRQSRRSSWNVFFLRTFMKISRTGISFIQSCDLRLEWEYFSSNLMFGDENEK